MDKALIRERFRRAMGTYDGEAGAQDRVAERLMRLLVRELPFSPDSVLEIGCGTGLFTRRFLGGFRPARLVLNDLCPEMSVSLADVLRRKGVSFFPGDAEQVAFPSGHQLVVSSSVFQWLEDPQNFLSACRQLILPGGYVAFSCFGPQNMQEVASLSGTSLPYWPMKKWENALDRYFQVVCCEEETVRQFFSSPWEVLNHLKRTGVTGISRQRWTKSALDGFVQDYIRRYSEPDGQVRLTYHPVYLIGKRV